jgi:RimJ/RimL family protein N-acetyltransferase
MDPQQHAPELYEAFLEDPEGRLWTYMPVGPFGDPKQMLAWAEAAVADSAQPCFAILDEGTGRALGTASYLRIKPAHGVIEVGSIAYAPALQRTPAATEAMFLMMRHVFRDLGYRRYEWKCDALNAASRAAAQRLGFTFDGLFEQAIVYKGRNRDTAWYSVLDRDWPRLEVAFEAWLSPENFSADRMQQRTLAACRR